MSKERELLAVCKKYLENELVNLHAQRGHHPSVTLDLYNVISEVLKEPDPELSVEEKDYLTPEEYVEGQKHSRCNDS